MKKTILALFLTAIIALPVSAKIEAGTGKARDIIVTTEDVSISADSSDTNLSIITIKNPTINYKLQKGNGALEPLTMNRFAELWTSSDKYKDSFGEISPNAQLSFWDSDKENYFESNFSIEKVVASDNDKLQLVVRFLDNQHPVHMTSTKDAIAAGRTTVSPQPATLSIAQVETHLKNHKKTSAILVVDSVGSSPWDPR